MFGENEHHLLLSQLNKTLFDVRQIA